MEEVILTTILDLKKTRTDIPQFLFISDIDSKSTYLVRKAILEFKESNKQCNEIDFIINSPGGQADEAYRIIRTLRKNFETVNVIVPFWVKSAATLLSLGGSTIIMDEFGEFGPLDAQLGKPRDDSPEYERESALNDEHTVNIIETHYKTMFESMFLQVYEHDKINIQKNELSKQLLDHLSKFYEPLLKQIEPYKLGDKRRKLDIAVQYANRILAQYSPLKSGVDIRKFVTYLVDGCPDHGFVIDYDLISIFLPNVFMSDHFGDEYKTKLATLSILFVEHIDEDTEYIGFIEKNNENISDEILSNPETLDNKINGTNFVEQINNNQEDDENKNVKKSKTT